MMLSQQAGFVCINFVVVGLEMHAAYTENVERSGAGNFISFFFCVEWGENIFLSLRVQQFTA